MKLEKQVLTLKNDISQLKIQPESQLNEITSVEELEKQVKQLQAQLVNLQMVREQSLIQIPHKR